MRRLVKILRGTYNDIYLAFLTLVRLTGEGINESMTWDPANLPNGESLTQAVTISGVTFNDYPLASFSLSLEGLSLTAYVSDTNEVTVVLSNLTGAAVNLASGTLYVRVLKRDPS